MSEPRAQQAAYFLLFASAVANVFSIAAGQIFLGGAVAALLPDWRNLRWPPMLVPLLVFVSGTLISLAFSPEPAAGLPQIKKFYVLLALLVAYNVIHSARQAIQVLCGWAIAGTANGVYGILEYVSKRQEAAERSTDFYLYYVANRITGFQSHWMTFSGVEMILLLMLAARLMFSPRDRWTKYVWISVVLMSLAIMLSDTRSVWIATAAGGAYVFGMCKPRYLWAVPLLCASAFAIAPDNVQQRVVSIWRPKRADSNEHRRVVNLTGLEMIKAHPLLGVGPQRVGKAFQEYLPREIRELPSGYYEHLHSIYIHYAAERGLPATAGLIWACVAALIHFVRSAKQQSGASRAILHGAAAVVLAVLIEGAFELNLGDSEVLLLFLVALAMGYRASENYDVATRT